MLEAQNRLRNFAPFVLILVSVALAVGAYLQVLYAPFVTDDNLYITGNAKLAGLQPGELWRLFVEPYNGFNEFLPLRDLSYWFDMTMFGMTPAAFRISNLILYLLCLPLVYSVTVNLWRYFRPADSASATWAAAVVTALFALHPSHVEAVVWISGRKDLLAAMFALLALWFAVNARRERGLSTPYAVATLVTFVAVMLSKVLFAALAPVIALLWLLFWRDSIAVTSEMAINGDSKSVNAKSQKTASHTAGTANYLMLLWPLSIIVLAILLTWMFMTSSVVGTYFYLGIEAAARTLAVLGWLLRLALSPEHRHFIYPVFEDPYLPAMIVLGVLVLCAVLVAVVKLLRKGSLESFAMLAFLLLCLPYIHLFPYGPPSLVSDRWLTLAVWPVLLIVVALMWRLKPVPRAAVLIIIGLSWSVQTTVGTRDWSSTEAIIKADYDAYPGNYMTSMYQALNQIEHGLYSEAYATASSISTTEFRDVLTGMIKAGQAVRVDAVTTGMPEVAMSMLRASWQYHTQPPVQSQWNSPISFFWIKRRTFLKGEWAHLVQQFPHDMSVSYAAGLWMLDAHQFTDSISYLRSAAESQQLPLFQRGTAYYNLGFGLMNIKQFSEAEQALHAALNQIQPERKAYCLLAAMYQYTGRNAEAARAKADCQRFSQG